MLLFVSGACALALRQEQEKEQKTWAAFITHGLTRFAVVIYFKKSDIFRCVYVLFDAYSVAHWLRPHVCSLDIKKGIFSVTFCPR